jgi:RimJ/RimL family protein N-acetyltransferase
MLLGICGGNLDADDPFNVEIVIHLAKEYEHQGYGTEALKSYIAWLKYGKRATHIYASVHPDNQASLNMVKKCGFVQNGFVQYEDTGFVDEPYFELKLD